MSTGPSSTGPAGPVLDADLLSILRCPVTRSRLHLVLDADGTSWLHNESGLRYPVTDGIPVLLPDAGVAVSADQR